MELVSEYLRNAAECLKLSGEQRNEAMREKFLRLAHWWLRLAATREETLKLLAGFEDETKPD